MKTFITFTLAIATTFVLAQENIRLESGKYNGFGDENADVFIVEVERVSMADFMNHWERYLKSESQAEIERTEADIILKRVTLKRVGNRVMNVYMHFQPMESGTKAFVGFQDTLGNFIGPDNPQYGISIRKLILDETQKVYVKTRGEDVNKEETYLKSLEKDLAKIKDKETNLEKDILKNKQEIDKLKNEISINEGVMEELVIEISDRRSAVNALSADAPKEVRKKVEKEAKETDKKRDKLRKQIDRDKQKIFDLEQEISDFQYQLSVLEPQKEEANRKVEQQRELLIAIQNDLQKMKR